MIFDFAALYSFEPGPGKQKDLALCALALEKASKMGSISFAPPPFILVVRLD